jgi:CheY-like chemotaxis protein
MKILLIDDSPMQQKIARIYLEKGEGHEVISAADGREGVEMARQNMPDMILLDVEMPVMNGNDALKALKSDPETKDIPVVMCTANDEIKQEEFIAMGAIGYIKKPHGFGTLRSTIKEIFGEKALG